MSFLYPRQVSFTRPAAQQGIGAQPYGGQTREDETPVVDSLPASIQARREGTRDPAGLPGDTTQAFWWVLMPKRALAAGVVQARDVMTDDLGNRFVVVAPYVDSLGARLSVMSLIA